MADLLIEIICEEIPARMQARAAADLERLITGKLGEAGLEHGKARHFVAPRHLALYVEFHISPPASHVIQLRLIIECLTFKLVSNANCVVSGTNFC